MAATSNVLEITSKNGFHLLLLKVNLTTVNKTKRYFVGVNTAKRDALLKTPELTLLDFEEKDTILSVGRPEVTQEEIDSAKNYFLSAFLRDRYYEATHSSGSGQSSLMFSNTNSSKSSNESSKAEEKGPLKPNTN